MLEFESLYSANANNMKQSLIRELLKLTAQPGIISFAGGLPDPQTFPVEDLRLAAEKVFSRRPAEALQYGTTEGDGELKERLIDLEALEGIRIGSEEMLVVSASQQAIDLVCKLFLDPGDLVVAGRPTYLGEIQAIQSYRAELLGVPFDGGDDGFDMEALRARCDAALATGRRIKYLYVVPDFQNPTGICWSLAKRRELLDFSYERGLLLVEDCPYRQIRFLGESLPSLYRLDQEGERRGNVIGFRTFSKILAPGTRLGWIVARPEIIARLVVAKQAVDLCSNVLTQAIVAEYLAAGTIHGHVERTRELYRGKRDRMIAALEREMPRRPDLSWTEPEGGLFLWLRLPRAVDTEAMFYAAVERKVAYVAGSAFYFDDPGRNAMRLNFSYASLEQIDEGIARLGRTIREELARLCL